MPRKKGVRNYEYVVVREIPPRCPKCDSSDLTQLSNGVQRTDIGGKLSDGTAFTRVERRVFRCNECGQAIKRVQYLNYIAKADRNGSAGSKSRG